MSDLQFPVFGEENLIENQLNAQARVLHFPEREVSAFHACCQWLMEQGFEEERPVHIGNDVWIGDRVMIMPGVHIGDGSVIGAGAVVTGDIPPYSIAVGVPAKVIRSRK